MVISFIESTIKRCFSSYIILVFNHFCNHSASAIIWCFRTLSAHFGRSQPLCRNLQTPLRIFWYYWGPQQGRYKHLYILGYLWWLPLNFRLPHCMNRYNEERCQYYGEYLHFGVNFDGHPQTVYRFAIFSISLMSCQDWDGTTALLESILINFRYSMAQ